MAYIEYECMSKGPRSKGPPLKNDKMFKRSTIENTKYSKGPRLKIQSVQKVHP